MVRLADKRVVTPLARAILVLQELRIDSQTGVRNFD